MVQWWFRSSFSVSALVSPYTVSLVSFVTPRLTPDMDHIFVLNGVVFIVPLVAPHMGRGRVCKLV